MLLTKTTSDERSTTEWWLDLDYYPPGPKEELPLGFSRFEPGNVDGGKLIPWLPYIAAKALLDGKIVKIVTCPTQQQVYACESRQADELLGSRLM